MTQSITAIPKALSGTTNVMANLQTLSNHIQRINEGANEKPWTESHIVSFLQNTTSIQLMELLTQLGFRCTTERANETIYQHPEVEKNPIKASFLGTLGVLAHRSIIDQVARAIFQFANNQYNEWHAAQQPVPAKPGEADRTTTEAMLAPVAFA